MDHHTHHLIAQALDALTAPSPHPPQRLSADELIIAMSDLATIAGVLGRAPA